MDRILLTGAAGFLGSHLAESLLSDGHEVVGIDNLVTGKRENLDGVFDREEFSFLERDVSEYVDVDGELDWVIHLASLASPQFYEQHPIKTLKVGALGTLNTLGVARETDASYLFASTSEVYGDPEVNPQPEDYHGRVDPFGPRSCYDESKRYGESLVRAYRERHGIDVRVMRIFNTYGPRMRADDGRVIPTFISQALAGRPLTVYGDGSQTRSFCYVSDLIAGARALMDNEIQEPVNLGNPDERTIRDLAELVIERTDSDSEIINEALRPDDPQVRKPDLSRAETALGWRPTVPIEEGLDRTIESFAAREAGAMTNP